ncbi:MAG: hypothetical protein OXN89_07440 [Bryobacterales bacterium]|nr:hypothetical protein [Bryobacterales bacterium]
MHTVTRRLTPRPSKSSRSGAVPTGYTREREWAETPPSLRYERLTVLAPESWTRNKYQPANAEKQEALRTDSSFDEAVDAALTT